MTPGYRFVVFVVVVFYRDVYRIGLVSRAVNDFSEGLGIFFVKYF